MVEVPTVAAATAALAKKEEESFMSAKGEDGATQGKVECECEEGERSIGQESCLYSISSLEESRLQ